MHKLFLHNNMSTSGSLKEAGEKEKEILMKKLRLFFSYKENR